MIVDRELELFLLKCASMRIALNDALPTKVDTGFPSGASEKQLDSFISQFSEEVRLNALRMADYYQMFYMLENDIRKLIDGNLSEAYGVNWWSSHTPQGAKEECRINQQREMDAGTTSRSDSELDYVSFGQLGDIMRHNWDIFGGILSNQKALNRIMSSLNNLRGPIAHCGVLAEDEVDRLKLTIKDWFRLLEGPKP